MKFVLASALVILVVQTTGCAAFFGSKYNVPQSASISKTSNAIISYLNKADRALEHMKKSSPQNAEYLRNGADSLTHLIESLIEQVVPVYQSLSKSVTDKTTKTTYQFIVILESIESSAAFLSNDSIPILASISTNFGKTDTTALLSSTVSDLAAEVLALQSNIRSIKGTVVAAVAAKPQYTATKFLSLVTAKLNSIIVSLGKVSSVSNKLAAIIPQLVSAIKTGNAFHAKLNDEISEAQIVMATSIRDYITASAKTLTLWNSAVVEVITHANTVNNSFVFEELPYELDGTNTSLNFALSGLKKTLNQLSVDYSSVVQTNVVRFNNLNTSIALNVNLFNAINLTAMQVYHRVMDVLNPDECVDNFPATLLEWPSTFARYLKSSVVPDQLAVEKQVVMEIVSILQKLIKHDISFAYNKLKVCFSPSIYFSTQSCLDTISNSVCLASTKISNRASQLPQMYGTDANSSGMIEFASYVDAFSKYGGIQQTCSSSRLQ